MRTVVDEGIEYVTVWDGSHQGRDADLFRRVVAPASVVHGGVFVPTNRDLSGKREELIGLLRQRPRWKVKALRLALGLDPGTIAGLIDRLDRDGKVCRPCWGVVAWNHAKHVSNRAA